MLVAEPLRRRGHLQFLEDVRRIQLQHQSAGLADEECRRLALMGMRTGNKGIAALDLVDEPMRQKEIERAIDSDRGRPRPVLRHALDDVIGADGGVAARHAIQDFAALPGQAGAAPLAGAFGPRQKIRRALGMIMMRFRKGHFVTLLQFVPDDNQGSSDAS